MFVLFVLTFICFCGFGLLVFLLECLFGFCSWVFCDGLVASWFVWCGCFGGGLLVIALCFDCFEVWFVWVWVIYGSLYDCGVVAVVVCFVTVVYVRFCEFCCWC